MRDSEAGPARRMLQRAGQHAAAATYKQTAVAAPEAGEGVWVARPDGGGPALLGISDFLGLLVGRSLQRRRNDAKLAAVRLAVSVNADEISNIHCIFEAFGRHETYRPAFVTYKKCNPLEITFVLKNATDHLSHFDPWKTMVYSAGSMRRNS